MKILFVRHGESEHNRVGLFAGSTDSPLTQNGIDQARQLGEKLLSCDISCAVTYVLARSIETARHIQSVFKSKNTSISLTSTPLLNEINMGNIENTPKKRNTDKWSF